MKRNPSYLFYLLLSALLLFSTYQYFKVTRFQRNSTPDVPVKSEDSLIVLANPDVKNLWPYNIRVVNDIFLINQIYQGLIQLNNQLVPIPDLALYWKISPDEQTYTFFLDSTRMFHNGKRVTAYDVAASFHYFFKNYQQSYNYPYFKVIDGVAEFLNGQTTSIRGISVLDSFTVQIQLRHPFSSFLTLLALPEMKILPRDVLQTISRTEPMPIIGSGPYKIETITDSALVLKAAHWNKNDDKPPYIKYLYFPLGKLQERFADSLQFDINVYYFFPQDWVNEVLLVLEQPSLGLVLLGFNCQKFPTNSVQFRKAVTLGLNRQVLVDSTFGVGKKMMHFTPFYYPHEGVFTRIPEFNLDSARYFLQKFLENYDTIPQLVFMADTTLHDTLQVNLIMAMLKDLGIPVKFLPYANVDPDEELELLKNNAHIFLWGWSQDLPDPLFYFDVFLRSTQQMNLWQLKSSTLDSLLNLAMVATNARKRNYYYALIEKKLAQKLPFVPLYSLVERIYLKKYIKGVILTPLGIAQLDLSRVWKNPGMRRDYYVIVK